MIDQAFAIRIHEYGGPENMVYEQIDVPAPGTGEVQIQQHAIGVNYLDTYNRRGVFPVPELPWGLGVEGAGVVSAVGEGVTEFAVGDRVAYASRPIGSYASVRNLPVGLLLHLPDDVSFVQAAAITLQGLTTHMLVEHVTHLKPGDCALVHAAAGGLGLLLVQWLKHKGCRVVGTVGSESKAKLAQDYGCDDVILYNEEPFTDGVTRLTGGKGVDAVFEGLGGQIFHESLTILKPFGHLVNLGQVAQGLPAVDLSALGPVKSLTISVPGVFAYMAHHPSLQDAADTLFGMVARGELRAHIGREYKLSETADAHRALEARETTGSVVLIPN